jgi:hypothetical protein
MWLFLSFANSGLIAFIPFIRDMVFVPASFSLNASIFSSTLVHQMPVFLLYRTHSPSPGYSTAEGPGAEYEFGPSN